MRTVLFKKWIPSVYENGAVVKGTGCLSDFVNVGLFHQWITENGSSGESFIYAIIEIADGTIDKISAYDIKFIDTLNHIKT